MRLFRSVRRHWGRWLIGTVVVVAIVVVGGPFVFFKLHRRPSSSPAELVLGKLHERPQPSRRFPHNDGGRRRSVGCEERFAGGLQGARDSVRPVSYRRRPYQRGNREPDDLRDQRDHGAVLS